MYKKIFNFLQQPVISNYTFNFIFLPLIFFIKNLKQKQICISISNSCCFWNFLQPSIPEQKQHEFESKS